MPINQYAVLHQIITNLTLLKLLQNADYSKLSGKGCRNSNIQTKIADKPLCCVPPNNNKQNPLINTFKMPIKVNSLEQTAETQICRQKLPINQIAVFHQIISNQNL